MKKKFTIGFIGMTHLGLNYSAVSAQKGNNVLCYDPSKKKIEDLKAEKIYITEPKLKETVKKNRQRIIFTNKIDDLKVCEIVYISSDVPTNKNNESSLSEIKLLIKKIIKVIKKTTFLVILCQVPPGFVRKIKFNKKFLYYQVETLVFGDAIQRASKPERIIIGAEDDYFPENKFKNYLNQYNCPIINMNYESAELAKIAINVCLVSTICVANTLSEVCEKINANWFNVTKALKLDKRIGSYAYLSPGMGIAGGNLERDLSTITSMGKNKNVNVDVIQSFIQHSNLRRKWAINLINSIRRNIKISSIAVWGLAYKENTNSVKNSVSLETIENLEEINIYVHDPVVKKFKFKNTKVTRYSDKFESLQKTELLAILTPWEEYKNIDLKKFKNIKIVIDPFKVIKKDLTNANDFRYFTMGVK